jgi:hypothetical protein
LSGCAGVISDPGYDEHVKIYQVIERFRQSIVNKDRSGFLSLFLQENIMWQPVMSDQRLAQLKPKLPQAIKARVNVNNNPVAFIDEIIQSKYLSEEIFSNIRINADSDVATVSFDYAFVSNGIETNHGMECWLLVRTENGWKILTIAWSVTLSNSNPSSAN